MSESKSGKIYANSEQRRTLMAIYLADNYPETSILEQVKIWDFGPTNSHKIIYFLCSRYPVNWALAWTG